MRSALIAGLTVAAAVSCASDPNDGFGGAVHLKWRALAPGQSKPAPPSAPAGSKPLPPRPTPDTAAARLEGNADGRGAVVWCPGPTLAIVTAAQGDTGLGLVIHPRDSLAPGTYPVLPRGAARGTAPGAGLALRFIAPSAVDGYVGASGMVTLTAVAGGRLSGRFAADVRAASAPVRLRVTGELRDLPVRVGGPACPT